MAMSSLLSRIILNKAPSQVVVLFPFAIPRSAEASATQRYFTCLLLRYKRKLEELTISAYIFILFYLAALTQLLALEAIIYI